VARNAVYILVTKSGPTKEDQLRTVRKVVPIGPLDEVYVDDMTEKYRRKDRHFVERTTALKQLRKDDRMVVASPGRLGIGRDDIRSVLHQLQATKHPLLDASTGKTVMWSEEVADAVAFLDRATVEHKAGAAANARAVKAALGHSYLHQEKPLSITEAEARQMWYDQVRYPSQKEIAERCGITARSLYNRFGPRSPETPLKRKKRR
jgi:hypothetical protein